MTRPRTSNVMLAAIGVIAIGALIVVVISVINLAQRSSHQETELDRAQHDRTRILSALDAQQKALTEANRRLVNAGKAPVVPIQGDTGATGPMGPQGPVGPRGPRGFLGLPGATGAIGATGATGESGAAGPKGDTGPAGPAGPAGADGKNGANGTATPGTYSCPDTQYVAGFTIAADGNVTLTCAGLLPPGQN